MSGQPGSEQRQRNLMFTLRLDHAEWARLDKIAEFSGVTKAEVVRRMLVHDHSRILPSRQLTQQILRIGNNANQIAAALNGIKARAEAGTASADMLGALDQLQQQLASAVSGLIAIRRDMESWR